MIRSDRLTPRKIFQIHDTLENREGPTAARNSKSTESHIWGHVMKTTSAPRRIAKKRKRFPDKVTKQLLSRPQYRTKLSLPGMAERHPSTIVLSPHGYGS